MLAQLVYKKGTARAAAHIGKAPCLFTSQFHALSNGLDGSGTRLQDLRSKGTHYGHSDAEINCPAGKACLRGTWTLVSL